MRLMIQVSSLKPNHRFFTSTVLHHLPLPVPPPLSNISQHTNLEKSLISLIKSCTHKTQLHQIHAYLIHTCYAQNHNVFLNFLTRISLPPLQNLSYSRKVFTQYPKPNLSLYNVVIRAYSLSNNESHQGFVFFREMLRSGISPDSFSTSSVMKCCVKMNDVHLGNSIHGEILKYGHQEEVQLITTLMNFYSSNAMIPEVLKLFDEMPHIDSVTYNVLVSCYIHNGRMRDALHLFDVMKDIIGCEPTNVTCLLMLQACANLSALDFGEKIHTYIVEQGFSNDLNVCNALISMYTRCGSVDKAHQVFDTMAKRDVITWTTMVSGLASNGHVNDAINTFRRMIREGFNPSEHTFTGVLSACSKKGLLEESKMFFDMMRQEFNITPNVYHYGCIVHLMGRAGLLYEAYNLIKSMTVKPDTAIWRNLLDSCKMHHNTVLGEQVVQNIIELKAQESNDYVLLLNIYTSANELEKVKEVKAIMETKCIRFTPGCSTIELKGKVHVFEQDDISHIQKNKVYEMLDEINQQLKIGGYEAKEVCYHSEKLAIAFGILSNRPGKKIKVAKDLHICEDCHNFAKFVSRIYDREVVITDRNKVHHFREGQCSCNNASVIR